MLDILHDLIAKEVNERLHKTNADVVKERPSTDSNHDSQIPEKHVIPKEIKELIQVMFRSI